MLFVCVYELPVCTFISATLELKSPTPLYSSQHQKDGSRDHPRDSNDIAGEDRGHALPEHNAFSSQNYNPHHIYPFYNYNAVPTEREEYTSSSSSTQEQQPQTLSTSSVGTKSKQGNQTTNKAGIAPFCCRVK